MKLSSIIPIENGLLQVKLDDGTTGVFDVKPYLKYEAFLPLNDFSEFKKIRNGGYYVEWDCGADLSLDSIAGLMEKIIA